MKIDGRPLDLAQLQTHVDGIKFDAWKPELVVIHHCGAPSLAQRPLGFIPQHMLNLKDYYEGRGWRSGPHAFIDEEKIWLFTPLNARGVHAVSFNRNAWGLEMLGDYDSEDPYAGRGLNVLTITAKATAVLLRKLGKDIQAIRFHRDDPKTSKSCPGRLVDKAHFTALVAASL